MLPFRKPKNRHLDKERMVNINSTHSILVKTRRYRIIPVSTILTKDNVVFYSVIPPKINLHQ